MTGDELFTIGVFVAGLLSFFSPCIFPLLPVYVAYLSGSSTNDLNEKGFYIGSFRLRPLLMLRTLLFVLGLSTVFISLGFGSGALGTFVIDSRFIAVSGAFVILFGIYQTGLIKLRFLEKERKMSFRRIDKGGYFGAFLLGLTFSFGWTPCIGPILAAVLSISAGEGSPAYGGFLMFIYTTGMAIPFLLISVFSDLLLQQMKRISKYLGVVKIVSGCILIVMGILLMTDKLNTIIIWFQ